MTHGGMVREQLDVKTSFIHERLEENIFMDQPIRFEVPRKENMVCLLKNSLFMDLNSPQGVGLGF